MPEADKFNEPEYMTDLLDLAEAAAVSAGHFKGARDHGQRVILHTQSGARCRGVLHRDIAVELVGQRAGHFLGPGADFRRCPRGRCQRA